ncbi:MAG TPA: response regulator [Burkholderiales bacterium]|jgi:CheY-like chemotaxis protein|nr:response regulator [Burkholderiales bacterium]
MIDFGDLRKLRIVVVDDERDTVATLCEILAEEGHDAVGACSGPEALREIARHPADAVLVDISMPGVSGYEVAREVSRLYGQLGPMMVAISGRWVGQTDRMLARLAGFRHFLEKPCDPKAVVDLLAPLRHTPAKPPVSLTEDTVAPPKLP